MHFSELTAPEQRVLGCLIEKRWTTPDQYPLSLNALRLACNQSTNRDPVTDYDESTVRDAAQRLSRYGLARLASGHTTRATKYRHLAEEALGLDRPALAALAVLLLRGPQTPGEIKGRSERMAPGATLADTEAVLATLIERGYVRRLPRRPGQKEERFEHMLGGASTEPESGGETTAGGALAAAAFAPATVSSGIAGSPTAPPVTSGRDDGLADRVEALEAEVARLHAQLEALATELGVELGAGTAGDPTEPGEGDGADPGQGDDVDPGQGDDVGLGQGDRADVGQGDSDSDPDSDAVASLAE